MSTAPAGHRRVTSSTVTVPSPLQLVHVAIGSAPDDELTHAQHGFLHEKEDQAHIP
ncbi:hypothetical protein AB0I84_27910 [Streptomyces spectabilis]|uniref:hypothetical protein n=1 Tax=Streptomyces spectabilis TaxID=68270 RepID=UPI0033F478E8